MNSREMAKDKQILTELKSTATELISQINAALKILDIIPQVEVGSSCHYTAHERFDIWISKTKEDKQQILRKLKCFYNRGSFEGCLEHIAYFSGAMKKRATLTLESFKQNKRSEFNRISEQEEEM